MDEFGDLECVRIFSNPNRPNLLNCYTSGAILNPNNTSDSLDGIQIQTENQRRLSIGQLADSASRITGQRCTPAMIRNYEKKGLISNILRTQGGFRVYSENDLRSLVCIKRMQAKGYKLDEIRERMGVCVEELLHEPIDLALPCDKRIPIMEAAMRTFTRKGFSGTSLQDIAQEAGTTPSAIYIHFQNKEDLFLALIDNLSFFPILDDIDSSLDHNDLGNQDIRQSLIKIGEGFLRSHVSNLEVSRMFIAESRNFPEVGKRYCERLVGPSEKRLEEYFSIQIKRGVMRPIDVKLATHIFYGMFWHFVTTQHLLAGDDVLKFSEHDRVGQLVDIFLSGVLAKDENRG